MICGSTAVAWLRLPAQVLAVNGGVDLHCLFVNVLYVYNPLLSVISHSNAQHSQNIITLPVRLV